MNLLNLGFVRGASVGGVIADLGVSPIFYSTPIVYNNSLLLDSTRVMNLWQGADIDGFCQIFEIIPSSGVITPLGTAFEYDTTQGSFNSAVLLDSNTVMNFYRDSSTTGKYMLLSITGSTGDISILSGPTAINGTNDAIHNSTVLLDSTRVMNFWSEFGGSIAQCQIFAVTGSTGEVKKLGSSVSFRGEEVSDNSALLINKDRVMNFWRDNSDSEGNCQIFAITGATGEIDPLGSPFVFDTTATHNSAVLVDTDKVINFWKNGSDGYTQMFSIVVSAGTITAMDSPLLHASDSAQDNGAILLDKDRVMLFRGGTSSGFTQIFTFNKTSGKIAAQVEPFNFDTTNSEYNAPLYLNSSRVVNFWEGAGASGLTQTFEIPEKITDITPLKTSLEFDTTHAVDNKSILLGPTRVMNFWSGSGADGFCQIFEINGALGTITGMESSFTFDNTTAIDLSALYLNEERVMNFWSGLDGDGFCQIFAITGNTGQISLLDSPLEYETFDNAHNSAVVIDDDHVMNFWHKGGGDGGSAQIFAITADTGSINALSSPYIYNTSIGRHNSSILIGTDRVMNFWEGTNNDGFCQIFAITASTGAITGLTTPLEFDTTSCSFNSSLLLSEDRVINAWTGGGGAGKIQIFAITASTGNISALGSPLTFDTSTPQYNSTILLDNDRMMNFWKLGDDSGIGCQIFGITASTGQISSIGSPITLNDSGVSGGYNSAQLVDPNRAINFWSDNSSDGRVQIFDIPYLGYYTFNFGNALLFDGSNDYVSMSSITTTSTTTISFWLKKDTAGEAFILQGATNTDVIYFQTSMQFTVFISSNSYVFDWNVSSQLDTWYHFVVTRNGSQTRVYRNGVEADGVNDSPRTTVTTDMDFDRIGGHSGEVSSWAYDGCIDELAIWEGTVATETDVLKLYNNGNGAQADIIIPSPNRYYKMNSTGSSTTATDDGVDGADGTLNNFPTSGMWVVH